MQAFIWLSFDLGVRGDYEGMYTFLDAHDAKECGDSVAAFWFQYRNDILKELASEVKRSVKLDQRSRIYVVYPGQLRKPTGRFIFGRRKSPPWFGYGPSEDDQEDVGE